jgi:integrase
MRKTAIKLTKVKVSKKRRLWCVTWPKIGKGRNRQFFKDKEAAETLLQQKLVEQENYGTAGLSFTEGQRSEFLECSDRLRPFGKTIRDAIAFYLPHLKATNRTCNAVELVDELTKAKKADGASQRYLQDLRSRLGQFAAHFNGNPVSEITTTEIDDWLRSLSDSKTGNRLAPTTRNNFRRVLFTAFTFALSRGYCSSNPAEKTAKAKPVEGTVGILTVNETSGLLENAAVTLLPYVAIGAFAGLRSAELERLDWKEVDLRSGLIEVTAAKSKSARRRFVRIRPNLAQWLKPYAKHRGSVTPSDYRELLDTAREAAGIETWPNNALRHGFASYHLAKFKDAAALALEMGHTNSNLVFQHYRQLVKPKQAEQYWKLAPAKSARGNVVEFSTAAAA